MALVTGSPRSCYAAEGNARLLRGPGSASCAVRRRMATHLFSSSAIWRASSATPIPELGVVRCNSASHVSKATLLLGIMQSFVFTIWELPTETLSVRHATMRIGRIWLLRLFIVSIARHNFTLSSSKDRHQDDWSSQDYYRSPSHQRRFYSTSSLSKVEGFANSAKSCSP